MEELLGFVETIPAHEATTSRIYGGEGRRVRSGRSDPRYLYRLAETVDLIDGVMKGHIPEWKLREVMSTSDFTMFADIIDRQLLARYNAIPSTWRDIAFRKVVKDFRDAKLYAI